MTCELESKDHFPQVFVCHEIVKVGKMNWFARIGLCARDERPRLHAVSLKRLDQILAKLYQIRCELVKLSEGG